MKRNSLLFALLVALFMPWAAQAQEELTVYEETTTTSNYAPMFVYYFDDFTRAQTVFPAEDLTDMTGGTITAIMFYTTSQNIPYTTASSADIYLTEVESSTISSYIDKSSATTVCTGYYDFVSDGADGGMVTITFDTPYQYNGGNLLFGCDNTEDTGYKSIYFKGVTATGASISGYNSSASGTISTNQRNFLPKTTFTFVPGGSSYCAKPTNVTITRDGTTATVTWEGEATDYNIDVDGTVTNNITSPYTFEVELSTTYTVMVQANCEGDLQSSWTSPVTLTTPDCWEGIVVEYTLADSYNDSWNGASITVIEGCGNIVATLNCPSGQSPLSGTLNLCGDYYEFVWNKGNYDNECSFTFTENGITLISATSATNYTNGEVLFTLGAESCAKPANLAASNVTNHSATLTWTGAEGQNNWEIKYNAGADFDPETEGTLVEEEFGITTPDYTFNKTLEANTHYYVYVRANCGDENYSCWVGADFTTGMANPSPIVTTVDEITPINAVLRWTAPAGDFLESYDIYYSTTNGQPTEESEIQYTGIDADFTSYIIRNLTEGYWYVYMRAYHGETDGYSSWTPYYGYGFQVPEACPKPTNLTASNPTPNSITLSWKEGASWQSTWTVAYATVEGFDPDDTEVATYVDAYGPVDENGTFGPFEVNGLESNTTYYFRVKGNCGNEYGQSEWNTTEVSSTTLVACPLPTNLVATPANTSAALTWTGYSDSYTVQYRTAGGYDVELIEGFEGGSLPAGWTIEGGNQVSTKTWRVGVGDANSTTGTHSGNYNALITHDGYDEETYLITPAMDFSVVSEASLNLWYINRSWAGDIDEFGVYYRVNGGEWNELFSTTEAHSTWTELNLTLTGLAANTQIGFKCYDNYGYGIGLDDITILGGEYNEPGEWITYNDNVTSTTATIEGLGFGTKYDAQVKANCGDEYCDYVTFTTNALKTFTTEGDWSVAANWTPAGVPTIEDVVSIEAAATITDIAYASEININGGSITIADGGQLVHNNTGVAATVKKTIEGYGEANVETKLGYYFIANPLTSSVNPADAGLITEDENYDLYDWAAGYELEWRNYKEDEFNLSYNNTPAYLYANMNTVELAFNGTVRSSENNVSAPVYVSSNEFGAWNLIGNPFVCNAYLVNNTGAALPYYKMNTTGDGYDAVTGEAIAPVTGIFYEAPANGSVYFTREAPANNGKGVLNMNLRSNNKQLDNAIVRFGEGQQMSKMSFRANSSKIYMPVEGKDYAIANAGNEGEMPVSFKAENNGTYTLSFNAEEVSFNYLHLIDNMTGADIDLLSTPSYSFEARTTDYASRFRLVFATGNNNEDSFAFFSNGSMVINNEGNATVQVIDVTGRIIKSESINGSANINVNAAPGVYMIRLVNGDNTKVQKVVVK